MDRRVDSNQKEKIYECISSSPGLHFREIQRRLGLPTGVLDYHVHRLHKHGRIRIEKEGKFTRYYPSDKAFKTEEKKIIALLRNENLRHIIIFVMEKGEASATQISEALKFSPSRLSWHLGTLLDSGLLQQRRDGRFRFYRVSDSGIMAKYLKMHKQSFIDKIVDRFIDTWAS
jgi:predicted transcriptional regulator